MSVNPSLKSSYLPSEEIIQKLRSLVAEKKVAELERERMATLPKQPFKHEAPRLGRNDPCFCGSGKKYKKCHLVEK